MPTLICFRWPWCSSVWELLYMYIFVLGIKSKANMFMGIWLPFICPPPTPLAFETKRNLYTEELSVTYIPLTFLGSIHRRPPSTSLHRAFTFMHTIPPRTMNERLLDIDSHSQQQCLPPPLSITGRFNRYPSAAVKRRTSYTRVCVVSVFKGLALVASLLVTNGKASHAIH